MMFSAPLISALLLEVTYVPGQISSKTVTSNKYIVNYWTITTGITEAKKQRTWTKTKGMVETKERYADLGATLIGSDNKAVLV